MANENRVQFNLKNVHYAVLTEAVGEDEEWGTPVAIPGAVTLTLDQVGELTPFYADGIIYYQSASNNGYSGSIEVAKIPDAMLVDVWGFTQGTTSKVLTEHADVEPKAVALLYQIDGDQSESLYCLYKCNLTRPGIGSTTNTNTKTPQTQSCDISAVPLPSNSRVFARTTADTPAQTKTGWFTSVFVEA